MQLLITVFFQMLSLVIMIGTGFIAAKREMLDDHTCAKLSALITTIFNPMLALSNAISSVGQIPLGRMGMVALVAAGMFAVFILIGMVLSPFFEKDPFQRKMYQMMFVFSNLGFIGIPVVSCVLGSEYVVYVTEFTLAFNLVFYSYGVALMEGKFSLASLKAMINPGNLLCVLAILVLVFNVTVPGFVATAVTYLGNVASPMALVTIGYTVAHASLKQIFGSGRLYLFSVLKLLVIPLVSLPLLRALPIPADLIPLFMIMFGMPVGNLPLILGTQKGIDCTTCSAGIIMTTILCIFTVPILVAVV